MTSLARIVRNHPDERFIVVELSTANSASLLKETSDFVRSREPEADRIKRGLEKFAPEVAEQFESKNIALSKAPLKLVFSKDTTIRDDLSRQVTSYIAISYSWHDEKSEWTRSGPPENLPPWPLPSAFVEGILKCLQSRDEGIWIDQLCIDQSNKTEKSLAIACMDLIYRSARQLCILLNDKAVEIPEVEEILILKCRELMSQKKLPETWDLSPDHYATMHSLFNRVLSSRWWTRSWCSHEFRVSRSFMHNYMSRPQFLALSSLRGHCVPISAMELVVFWTRLYSGHKQHLSMATNPDFKKSSNTFSEFVRPSMIQAACDSNFAATNGMTSIMYQVHDTINRGAKYAEDKVQISLNLMGLPLHWNPRRKKKKHHLNDDEVFLLCCTIALAAGEVNILTLSGDAIGLRRNNGNIDYSWACRSYNAMVESRIVARVEEVGIHTITPEFLEIDLLFLNGPVFEPTETSLVTANKILSDHGLYNRSPPLGSLAKDALKKHNGLLREMICRTLALYLDGGLKWMLASSRYLEEELFEVTSVLDWNHVFADPQLASASKAVLQHLTVKGDRWLGILHNKDFTDHNSLNSMVRLLAIITDCRFLVFQSSPGRAELSVKGDQGITVSSKLVLQDPRHRLAVPACLSQEQWGSTSRLWVLEEVDGDNSWRIRSKYYLFSCGKLADDEKYVVRKERQKVYGGYCGIAERN